MKKLIIALCFVSSSAWANITCSDYLANHEKLLPAAARVLAKKAPEGHTDEIHISVLHVILEEKCKQTPERPLANVLSWFNSILEEEYYQQGDGWLVFTEDGNMPFGTKIMKL